MRISEVEKVTGYSRHTLRFYESSGLIKPPRRTASNYRDYDQQTVQELLLIRQCQEMGFQLQEIHDFLVMRRESGLSCAKGAELLEQKLEEVADRIRQLKKLEKLLKSEQLRLLQSACEHGQVIPEKLQAKMPKTG
ncbi:MAG: MerR family transcriptional regulator [Hahellaceae bacterium]|nr:MerR family transcriptional regulator [Hahellaceae bacterium]MCP5168233.1 MerR family transcriptional regulator [Hahellaceae bacterium]